MPSYTQKELLDLNFENTDQGILGGLLRNGLYFLAASAKIGKTMIATALANHVANGTDYLGKSNEKSKVVYFDNDNYAVEAQSRIKALGFNETENIRYVFEEDAGSLYSIMKILQCDENIRDVRLVIIDCLANLEEFVKIDWDYQSVYTILKDFRDFIMTYNLTCVILHHTKKGDAAGQDRLLGSKAMSGAATGTILVTVDYEFSLTGKLEFILRHRKEVIPICKDEKGIGWILNEHAEENEKPIPNDLLRLMSAVVSSEDKLMKGTCVELAIRAGMKIDPSQLTRYLNKYVDILESNHIKFENVRSSSKRQIVIQYNPPEEFMTEMTAMTEESV